MTDITAALLTIAAYGLSIVLSAIGLGLLTLGGKTDTSKKIYLQKMRVVRNALPNLPRLRAAPLDDDMVVVVKGFLLLSLSLFFRVNFGLAMVIAHLGGPPLYLVVRYLFSLKNPQKKKGEEYTRNIHLSLVNYAGWLLIFIAAILANILSKTEIIVQANTALRGTLSVSGGVALVLIAIAAFVGTIALTHREILRFPWWWIDQALDRNDEHEAQRRAERLGFMGRDYLHWLKGYIWYHLGDYQRAEQHLREALIAPPGSCFRPDQILALLQDVIAEQGRTDEAQAVQRAIDQLKPIQSAIQTRLVMIKSG
jgi:hypothetical protein